MESALATGALWPGSARPPAPRRARRRGPPQPAAWGRGARGGRSQVAQGGVEQGAKRKLQVACVGFSKRERQALLLALCALLATALKRCNVREAELAGVLLAP